jgi:hypothetical protein
MSDITEHVEYHKDGTIWAKGHMQEGKPTGYGNGFVVKEPGVALVILRRENLLGSGLLMTGKEKCIK